MGHYFYLEELNDIFDSVYNITPYESCNFSEEVFVGCFRCYEGFLCRIKTDWVFVVFRDWTPYQYPCTGAVSDFLLGCDSEEAISVSVSYVCDKDHRHQIIGVRFGLRGSEKMLFVDYLNPLVY